MDAESNFGPLVIGRVTHALEDTIAIAGSEAAPTSAKFRSISIARSKFRIAASRSAWASQRKINLPNLSRPRRNSSYASPISVRPFSEMFIFPCGEMQI